MGILKMEISQEETNIEKEKVLCGVRNPKNDQDRSWLYNIFLKHIYRNDKQIIRNETKVNWLIVLAQEEIRSLRDHSCKVIPLVENISLEIDDDDYVQSPFKEGFQTLLNLFDKVMKDDVVKSAIKWYLTGKDKKPSEDYQKIMNAKKLLEEEEE